MKNKKILMLTLSLILIFSLIGCGQNKTVDKKITFESETVTGEKITSDVFKDKDATIVNIMATWCGPCISEMPHLNDLAKENSNIGVVAFVFDTFDNSGKVNEEAKSQAISMKNELNLTFPLIVTDMDFILNSLDGGPQAFPTTYIVDNEGQVLEGPIMGAKDKESWIRIVNEAIK